MEKAVVHRRAGQPGRLWNSSLPHVRDLRHVRDDVSGGSRSQNAGVFMPVKSLGGLFPHASVGGWRPPTGVSGFSLIEVLAVVAMIGTLLGLLLPAVQEARAAARQTRCLSNLAQIGRAVLGYEAARGWFPSGFDRRGERDHAWSSLILPYVEEAGLADLIDRSRPWDAEPGNRRAADARIPLYRCPEAVVDYPGKSDYFGVSGFGSGAAFDARRVQLAPEAWSTSGMLTALDDSAATVVTAASATDGLAHTLAVSEAADRGFPVTADTPPSLTKHYGRWATGSIAVLNKKTINDTRGEAFYSEHPTGLNGLYADGHAVFLADSIDPELLVALSTRNGGEAAVP
jgi:prepilin-type processing-associated H-X9-DG protein